MNLQYHENPLSHEMWSDNRSYLRILGYIFNKFRECAMNKRLIIIQSGTALGLI